MTKVLIIDDEAPARKLISELLKKHDDFVILGEAGNGFDALKMIHESKPDLLFLDVQMPKISGIELLEIIDEPPKVIFTTAYSEHAIKAFEMNAVDYLLKPIQEERFEQALNKIRNQNKKSDYRELFRSQIPQKELLKRIVVKTGHQIRIIDVDEILHINSDDDYVNFFTSDGKFLKKQNMKFLEEHLAPETFCRVHRSHIINLNQLERIEPFGKETYTAVLKNGEKISVSASGYKKLKSKLDF